MKTYQRPRRRVFKLPRKPSQLIRLSLRDLRKVEKRFWRFRVDMNNWHVPINGTWSGARCVVCQAGAVMAMRLKVPDDQYAGPDYFDRDTRAKLKAINLLRTGEVMSAMRTLGYSERFIHQRWPFELQDKYLGITAYKDDPEACYIEQRALARALEKRGL